MLPAFRCHVPGSKKEALKALRDLGASKVIAGGTDLLVELKGATPYSDIVDITRAKDLSWEADSRPDELSPLFTHALVAASPVFKERYPALSKACSLVGSPQIRNMGTIGGNLANASPAADSIPPMLIYNAHITLESIEGIRSLPLKSFLKGPYKTDIRAHELITGIQLEPLKGYRQGYKRLTPRESLALSRLSVAYAIKETDEAWLDVRVAIGSITPVCFRAEALEGLLGGQPKDLQLFEKAIEKTIGYIKATVGERKTHKFKIPILINLLKEIIWGPKC